MSVAKSQPALHEDFGRGKDYEKSSSDRSFGLVFGAVFTLIGVAPTLSGAPLRLWAVGVAVLFFLLAFVKPAVLSPLNRLWLKLGHVLQSIVSPIVLGALFFLTVAPIGLVLRLTGRDLLGLRWDRGASTYWVVRNPPGPSPESMRNQF